MGVKSCGKTRYRTSTQARIALEAIRRDPDKRAVRPCRSYACPYCHGWHLTHEPK
jgi:hypothetical protein